MHSVHGGTKKITHMPFAARTEKRSGYIEGKGFHEPDPAAEERRSLIQITMVIGMAIFAYLLIENLLTAILMASLR